MYSNCSVLAQPPATLRGFVSERLQRLRVNADRCAVVSPYYRNGNLVQYLKGLALDAPVDMLRMMHQISKGMSYLHGKSILHGDLKAANILVDDRLHCIISDFGQSEMKSEVFRLSRQPMPR